MAEAIHKQATPYPNTKYAMVIVAFGFSIVMLGVLVFGLASFKRSAAERAAAG